MPPETRLGVDVGGTFTDLVVVRDGRVSTLKVPSTPDAPERGVLDAVETASVDPTTATFVGHGTTVATNAVLERDWPPTALVTTAGFRDVVAIGRQDRPSLYDLDAEQPPPVVPRDRRLEASERLDERGDVLEPLTDAEADAVADRLPAAVETVAVSLLHAHENPVHEERLRAALPDDVRVSLSSEVHPEIREYERSLTTALDAALGPVVEGYLDRLESGLEDAGVGVPLRVVGSNGGLLTARAACDRPVDTVLSGPAAGVRGATHVAGLAGEDDLITMDAGGTSTDVAFVADGDPPVTPTAEVGPYPVGVAAVDVHTVGSGGGSVAWSDAGGALRVGPRSAGADPGPACYGRGGTEPTVTDAQLLLGRLDAAALGGDLDPDREAAEAALEGLADSLGLSLERTARGVVDVAAAATERALRVVSVERGHDPRESTLVAFGGAGPLSAPRVAARLEIPRVLVPRSAGVLSALGLLVSDLRFDYGRSRVRPWPDVEPSTLAEPFAALRARGAARLAEAEVPSERRRFERRADLRYAGQSFDLSVSVPDDLDEAGLSTVAERFHAAHERRYGHSAPDDPLELVAVRLRARGAVDPPDLRPPDPGGTVADARRERRPVSFDGDRVETPVYDRERLPLSARFDGPAVVEGPGSTTVVHPGQSVRVDDHGNLVVETGASADGAGAGR